MKKSNKTVRTFIVKLLAIFLVASVTFTYFYFTAKKADAAWFDDGWRYRVAIPISAHTTAESNVYLSLTGSDGINTTDTTKFQTDCGDIRFTDEGGNILPYFLTTACGLAQTGFHVFFESFPAGAQTIYYYYGNAGAPNGFSSSDFPVAATGVTLGTRGSETNSPVSPVTFWTLNEGFGQTVNNSMTASFSGTLGPDGTSTSTDPTWVSEDMCISGKCLQFTSSSSQYVNVSSSVAAVKSIGFWVRPTSTTTSLAVLNGAAGNASISVSSGTISAGAGFTTPTIYVNGIVSSTLVANNWQYVTITTGTGITASNIMLGRVNTGYLNGFMDEVKLYGVALTASQVKANFAAGKGKSSTIKGTSVSFGGGLNTFSQGLVGYWKMDESASPAVDSSGNGNNGTWTNTPAATTGKYGSGVYFDIATTNKYITVPASTPLNDLSQFTWSVWVNPSQLQSSTRVMSKAGSVSIRLQNISSTTRVYFEISCSGTDLQVQTTSTDILTLNTWNHVVGVWDGTSCDLNSGNIYINGKLAAKHANSVSGTGTKDTDSAGPLTLGNNWASYTSQIQGSLDETRIYNRVLSPAEVRQLYNWAPGPVGWWKMDENLGTSTTSDSSGFGHTATLADFPSSNWSSGRFGSALNFDGNDDWVNFYSSSLNSVFSGSQGTVTTWVKVRNPSVWADGATRVVFKMGPDTSNTVQLQKPGDTTLLFTYAAGGTSKAATIADSPSDWAHLAISWDKIGDKVNYYYNGVLRETDTGLGVWSGSLSSTRTTIGNNYDGTSSWDGMIDDMKIYNYARTPAQIVEDMNGGHSAPGGAIGTSVRDYNFDEGYGDYNFDSSPFRINGDMAGSLNTCPGHASCPARSASGKFGGALYFDGSNDYTCFSDMTGVPTGSAERSVSLWFKLSDKHSDMALFNYGNNVSGQRFDIYIGNSPVEMVSVETVNYARYFPWTHDTNWHHVVAVVPPGTTTADQILLYFDGVLQTTSNSGTPNSLATASITACMGVLTQTAGSPYKGYLDEVKVYSFAMTPEQVKLEYNQGLTAVWGSVSTDSSNNPSNSKNDSYCPPGQGSTCTPPIGEWNLNETAWTNNCSTATAFDTSSNNLTLTSCPNGTGPTGGLITKYGRGGYFDGTDDYLENSSATLNFANNVTISAWVKPMSTPAGDVYVVDKTNNNRGYSLGWNSGRFPRLRIGNGTAYVATTGTTALNIGQWYHITGTANSSGLATVYLNGVLAASNASAGVLATTTGQTFKIGSRNAVDTITGFVDEVRVYDYARSAAQVAWDYNKGAPVAWWKMDENKTGNSNSIYDSSLNGFNGTTNWGAGSGMDCTITGKINYACDFDGDDSIQVTSNTTLYPTTISVSAWVKIDTYTNDSYFVSFGNSGTDGYHLGMYNGGGSNTFTWFAGGPPGSPIYSKTIPVTGQWYHLVGIYDYVNMKIYVNGKLETSSPANHIIFTPSTNLFIGRRGQGTNFVNGQIDDVRIYNYPLTDIQVKTVMNDGSAVRFAQ